MTPILTAQYNNLIDEGPIINVCLGPVGSIIDQSTLTLTDLTNTITVRALVDTGSNRTLISKKVAKLLKLKAIGKDTGFTALNDKYEANKYKIDFLIPECRGIYDLEVRSGLLNNQEFDCIIGRDVLSRANLIYNGKENRVIIEFE